MYFEKLWMSLWWNRMCEWELVALPLPLEVPRGGGTSASAPAAAAPTHTRPPAKIAITTTYLAESVEVVVVGAVAVANWLRDVAVKVSVRVEPLIVATTVVASTTEFPK